MDKLMDKNVAASPYRLIPVIGTIGENEKPIAAHAAQSDADAIFKAAINCAHSIDANGVTLHFDAKKPGHNALSQLHARLSDAFASPTPASDDARDAARYRHLKECNSGSLIIVLLGKEDPVVLTEKDADEEIDAAIAIAAARTGDAA